MVGIVILDYNNPNDTINCIESVIKYTPQDLYKIIVVENGSNNNTISIITSYIKGKSNYGIYNYGKDWPYSLPIISLLISNSNDGYAEGNNKALRLFEKDPQIDKILILNNDILFIEDVISRLIVYSEKKPDIGIISPILYKKDSKTIDYNSARYDYKKLQFFWDYLFAFKDFFGIIKKYERNKCILLHNPECMNNEYVNIDLPSGSCMMINKELFKSIGYFDNNTFLYFEENILYRKLLKLGKKNYLIPKIKCIHLGASTSRKSPSAFTMKCQMKSTAYYLRFYRNAPCMAAYVRTMSHLTLFKIWILKHLMK